MGKGAIDSVPFDPLMHFFIRNKLANSRGCFKRGLFCDKLLRKIILRLGPKRKDENEEKEEEIARDSDDILPKFKGLDLEWTYVRTYIHSICCHAGKHAKRNVVPLSRAPDQK